MPGYYGARSEALCRRGFTLADETVQRGVDYLVKNQERNGSWYGRWGVNYVYGTSLALRGLRAAQAVAIDSFRRAAKWLISVQNADGGWGESCDSYRDDTFVPAPSTPSQTAWALMGLMAAGEGFSRPMQHGCNYLLSTQREDGTWDEEARHGHRLSKRFLFALHAVPAVFPAPRAGVGAAHARTDRRGRRVALGGPAEGVTLQLPPACRF